MIPINSYQRLIFRIDHELQRYFYVVQCGYLLGDTVAFLSPHDSQGCLVLSCDIGTFTSIYTAE